MNVSLPGWLSLLTLWASWAQTDRGRHLIQTSIQTPDTSVYQEISEWLQQFPEQTLNDLSPLWFSHPAKACRDALASQSLSLFLKTGQAIKQQVNNHRQQWPKLWALLQHLNGFQGLLKASSKEVLGTQISKHLPMLQKNQQILAQLDALAAKVHWMKAWNVLWPSLSSPPSLQLKKWRNPWLLLEKNAPTGPAIHPLDLQLDDNWTGLLLYGPPNSGKTATLKGLALTFHMAWNHLPLPVTQASCPPGRNVWWLSGCPTEGSMQDYLALLQALFREATSQDMVVIDHLEGVMESNLGLALAKSVLDFLHHQRIRFIVSTYHTEVLQMALSGVMTRYLNLQHIWSEHPAASHWEPPHQWPALLRTRFQTYLSEAASSPPPLLKQVDKVSQSPSKTKSLNPAHSFQIGQYVRIDKLGQYGEVDSLPDRNGMVYVRAHNQSRLKCRVVDLTPSSHRQEKKDKQQIQIHLPAPPASMTCDLHHISIYQAIGHLEKFLDGAYYHGLSPLTVIHGKGDGVMRQIVHDYLQNSPYVKTFRLGQAGEGDSGSTVVYLQLSG